MASMRFLPGSCSSASGGVSLVPIIPSVNNKATVYLFNICMLCLEDV